jgi:PHP family Zn ribbon phosphoesterase
MRIRFRRKSRYQRARDLARRMVQRVRRRLHESKTEAEEAPPQRPRLYRARPVLRIIIKD